MACLMRTGGPSCWPRCARIPKSRRRATARLHSPLLCCCLCTAVVTSARCRPPDYALLLMFCDSQSRPSYRPSPDVAQVLWMYLQVGEWGLGSRQYCTSVCSSAWTSQTAYANRINQATFRAGATQSSPKMTEQRSEPEGGALLCTTGIPILHIHDTMMLMYAPVALAQTVQAQLLSDLRGVHGVWQVLLVCEDQQDRIPQLLL